MSRANAVQIVLAIGVVGWGLWLSLGPGLALAGVGMLLLADAYMPDDARRE